jgi:hypothetical protein
LVIVRVAVRISSARLLPAVGLGRQLDRTLSSRTDLERSSGIDSVGCVPQPAGQQRSLSIYVVDSSLEEPCVWIGGKEIKSFTGIYTNPLWAGPFQSRIKPYFVSIFDLIKSASILFASEAEWPWSHPIAHWVKTKLRGPEKYLQG